jgi:hypothetical protein
MWGLAFIIRYMHNSVYSYDKLHPAYMVSLILNNFLQNFSNTNKYIHSLCVRFQFHVTYSSYTSFISNKPIMHLFLLTYLTGISTSFLPYTPLRTNSFTLLFPQRISQNKHNLSEIS